MTNPLQAFRRQAQAYQPGFATPYTVNDGEPDVNPGLYQAYSSELYAFINALSGTRTVVSATSGYGILVVSYTLSAPATGPATVTFKDGGTAISPLISLPTNGVVRESDPNGLFRPSTNDLNVTVNATVGVRVTYILVMA